MAERDELINPILLRASEMGARLFRQNTGMAWVGKVIRNGHQVVVTEARPFHAGLCVGSSDIIGITPVLVTPDMVGKTVGVFTAYEAKTGKLQATADQKRFIEMVRKLGGIAKVVRSPDDIERVP
ncbi:hypothetical protein [Microvirga sp. G4-2]|uniref:hypothetical protein n=1 Tax=Microvirga sp. G4-2 TaxID=3434467 RepID=UPI004043BC26